MNPFMSVQGDTLLIGARFIRDLPVLLLNEFRVQRERKRNKERERERGVQVQILILSLSMKKRKK